MNKRFRFVIIGVILAALGVGAWFAYHHFFDPQPLYAVKFPGDRVADEAIFSPDGHYLVLTGLFEITLLDATNGKQFNTWQTEAVIETIVFSPGSHAIVFYTQDADHLSILTIATGAIESIPLPESYHVRHLAFNPDGSLLAVAGSQTLMMQFPDYALDQTLPVASRQVAFSANGQQLVIVDESNTLAIYETAQPDTPIITRPELSESKLTYLQLSADGRTLLLADEEGTSITLDSPTLTTQAEQPLPDTIDANLKFRLVISPKGDLVAALQVDRLWLFRPENGEVVSQFKAKDHMIALGFTASGDRMAVYTHKGDEFTLSVWEADDFLDRYGP